MMQTSTTLRIEDCVPRSTAASRNPRTDWPTMAEKNTKMTVVQSDSRKPRRVNRRSKFSSPTQLHSTLFLPTSARSVNEKAKAQAVK